MSGQTVMWLGVMFNHVDGNVTLTDITVNDEHPDAPGRLRRAQHGRAQPRLHRA